MIRFSQLVAEGLEAPFDMILPAGLSAAVITSRERENEAIIRLMIGFQQPLEGSLVVYDVNPLTLRDAQLSAFRRKIGIVYSDGGMISNLNVWDNLTLQLSYDGECRGVELESRGKSALQLAGYDGPLGILPGRLNLYQRRQIAFARILLAEPDLVVYHSFFDGLTRSEQTHLRFLAEEYHHQDLERTALFLTSYPDSLTGFEFDFIYNRGGISPS